MFTEINGTIKLVGEENGQKIQLTIPGSDYEEFKKYKDVDRSGAIIDDKFYVGCTLDDQQLYITGSYPQEELGDDIIIDVRSVGERGGKCFSRLEEMKNLLGLNDGKEKIMVKALSCHPTVQLLEEKNVKTTELEAAKKKAEEELKQELQDQLDAANKGKEELQEQLNNRPSAAQLQAKDDKINKLNDQIQQLTQENTTLKDSQQTTEKDKQIKTLTAQVQQLQTAPNDTAAQLQAKEVVKLNKQLEESKSLIDNLQKEKQTLEDKNKTTEQPKQGNGAKYTATVGMGLAAGLIAFTALERTVRLEMLVMIGIAVASALVAGGITYAALPSTQVDEAKAREVNENGKSK